MTGLFGNTFVSQKNEIKIQSIEMIYEIKIQRIEMINDASRFV